jgi:acyl-coenzyme A thioesterase PaaI-like protein
VATVPALELDTGAAGYTRSTGVHFGGFPGVWEPGRPVPLAELGFETDTEALELVDELGLPLRQVSVDPGDDTVGMPARPNHVLSQDQQLALDNEAAANWPPATHAAADAAAATAGLEWPHLKMKVDEKVAFLEAARDGRVTTDGEPLTHDDTVPE